MPTLLSDHEVSEALTHLPNWGRESNELLYTVELSDFSTAIQVVNRIAEIAESINHHPDIDIRWRRLTFRLSTHVAGGITQYDISLAEQIDETLRFFDISTDNQ